MNHFWQILETDIVWYSAWWAMGSLFLGIEIGVWLERRRFQNGA